MENIKIKGNKYQISFIDTEDTIKNLIALKKNTFGDYIKFTTFNPELKDISIELLTDELKIDIDELEQRIDELHTTWGVTKKDIALEWLLINKKGKLEINIGGRFLPDDPTIDAFRNIDQTEFWRKESIEDLYKDYQERKEEYIKELKETVDEETQYEKEYQKYNPIETSNFLQDSVIVEYKVTLDLDPLELFDKINLTPVIPYALLRADGQSYYKLLKDLVPQPGWLESDTTFLFKLQRGDDWGTATINYESKEEPYNAVMVIETSVIQGKEETDEEKIKNELLGVLGINVKINDRAEKGIKGVFAVPEMTISRNVLLDLITNEPMISHYLYVNETRELSSQKSVLYLYYSPSETESQILTVFLSEREASRSDPFYISKELLLHTPYLNVRVSRANTVEQIERFMKAFAVILSIYKKKTPEILGIYDKLIPGFKTENAVVVKKRVKIDEGLKALQIQNAELFVHGYPTECERKRQPIPIKTKDKKMYEKQGLQVMEYPKESKNYYVCSDNSKFKYPGLLENKLYNKVEYPYLPCCYAADQMKGNKLLNIYLEDIEATKRIKTGNIVAKKAIGRDKWGYLPRNIYYILNKAPVAEMQYLRQGVAFGPNSFIEAVLLAFDLAYPKLNPDEKTSYVKDFRNNLASKNMAAVIQELYDVDTKKIIEEIRNPELEFDSKVYVGLLEQCYNCQIVVFERTENNPNGEIEIPRYTQGYLYKKLDPSKITVLIYKHLGIRGDHLVSPHYELIIGQYKSRKTRWYIEDNKKLINIVYSYFLRSYKLNITGLGRYKTVSDLPFKVETQIIDHYGKCRGFVFDKDVYLTVSPLPPMQGIEIVDIPDRQPLQKDVLQFIKRKKLKIVSQDILDDRSIGVFVDLVDIPYAFMPFKPADPIARVPSDNHSEFSIVPERDLLKQTLINRKIADFMMQLLLYKFSIWRSKKKRVDKEISNLVDTFLKKELTIEPGHFYNIDNLPRRLSLNSDFFDSKGRLIADSKQTKIKLSYYLRFMVHRNKQLVERFNSKTYLNNYYTYTDDFTHSAGQLIFIGSMSISNWIENKEHSISNDVHIVAQSDVKEPYFFSHWAMNGGKPVIFQNVRNGRLSRALAVASKFNEEEVNIGYDASLIDEIKHTVYFMEDGILKKDGEGPIRVWRFEDDYYAALL